MTITLDWWAVPLLLNLIGVILSRRDYWMAKYDSEDISKAELFTYNCFVSFGLPWGIYGVCRAIFG